MTSTSDPAALDPDVTLFRVDPRARRISLTVCPARRRLVLTAPSERRRREAYAFLQSRLGWAMGQLAGLPDPMPLAPGGSIPLRGQAVRLLAAPGRGAPRLEGEALHVPGRAETFAGRVRRFLKAQAGADLQAALGAHCAALDRPAPPLVLRDTRSRWGSCSSDGRLNFSWRLVCAPPFVLDYVAGHEAAHLVHHNHGPRFRALERRLCPRVGEASAWLAENGPLLHAVGAEA